ncbi:MAG: VWA domain-containing protein [Pyrinomonadaceae bacterium]|nr:VWA domain-containing protein [Pyrinomonadaceae bacterium]
MSLVSIFCTLSALGFLLFVTPSWAWRRQDDEVVRVNADLVVLNVTVTDKHGRYARKIPRADFKILEDGREQTISTFGVEETPFAAALLLDTSGSMEGRISMARAAAIRFLDGLRPEDVAAVYNFDTKVEQMQDFSPGRDLPPMAYDLRAQGYTALNDAIVRAAIDISKRAEKKRAIVVLSDGMDTRSKATSDKALSSALAADATIYTVDLSDPGEPAGPRQLGVGALKNFASKSGGRYVPTPGGKALGDAFAGIVEELSNQYTVGYQPTNRARDGRWRAIEIQLARSDLNARTRRGYRTPSNVLN